MVCCLGGLWFCDFQGLFYTVLCSFGGEVLRVLALLFFFCILLVMRFSEMGIISPSRAMRLSRIHSNPVLDFYTADLATVLELPLFATGVSAGFPSPADDYVEIALDLNRELVKHPAATFYARVKGSSMIDAGIEDGDLLVIDKALEAKDGDIAVCFLNGEFTVKRLSVRDDGVYLVPANAEFKPIRITEENDFLVWGVVAYIIHKPR